VPIEQSASVITVTYMESSGEWRVSLTASDKVFTTRAADLLDARGRVDRLIGKLAKEGISGTSVHMIDGSAVAFTRAYLTAKFQISEDVTHATER
jgi:hypothetical protein